MNDADGIFGLISSTLTLTAFTGMMAIVLGAI